MVILIVRKFENLSNVRFDELQKNGIDKVYKNFRMFEVVPAWTIKLQSALRSVKASVLM